MLLITTLTVFLISFSTLEVKSATSTDLRAVFRTPKRDYDKFEILERSNFDDHTRVEEEQPKSFANAQILLRFGSDECQNCGRKSEECHCEKSRCDCEQRGCTCGQRDEPRKIARYVDAPPRRYVVLRPKPLEQPQCPPPKVIVKYIIIPEYRETKKENETETTQLKVQGIEESKPEEGEAKVSTESNTETTTNQPPRSRRATTITLPDVILEVEKHPLEFYQTNIIDETPVIDYQEREEEEEVICEDSSTFVIDFNKPSSHPSMSNVRFINIDIIPSERQNSFSSTPLNYYTINDYFRNYYNWLAGLNWVYPEPLYNQPRLCRQAKDCKENSECACSSCAKYVSELNESSF